MARKHNLKRTRVKQAVERVIVKPEKRTTERKIVTDPTTGELKVVHTVHVENEVVRQGKAQGSTVNRAAKRRRKK